ncbi:MAG TPA: 4-coumarate--CoA ligase, partial [Phenylobacterium sp.]
MHNWWRDGAALERFVGDLVAGELQRLRPGAVLAPRPWSPDLDLVEDLGCDSLELTELAMALAEVVQLHRSGVEDYLLVRRSLRAWTAIVAAGLERASGELTFRTSGSTGAAKPCDHRLAELIEEVEALAAILPARTRILSAAPAHHIYGFLFTVLLPQRLGVPVVDVRQRTPRSLAAELAPGDLVVGHPAFWTGLLRSPTSLAGDVHGVTSTAPCPYEVVAGCLDLGLARMVQVYGSSETAGVGWRENLEPVYRLFPYWRRAPAGDGLQRVRDGGARVVALQDGLEWSDEDRFRLAGRKDQAVQVGGHNVFPQSVRACLLDHPAVADAAVRLMAPHEGSRLKAFVVPAQAGDHRALAEQLTAWCAARLTAPERPKAFSFGAELPAAGLGKLTDWPLEA